MPEDVMIPAGNYKVRKRFRNEEHRRKKKDMPWTKQILDLDENRLFGRTAWAWCRIVSYYLVLYSIIFVIVLCLYLFFCYYLIVPDRPNILKTAPGVSIVPSNASTLTFYPNQMTDVYPICDRIDDFLENLDDDAMNFFEEFNRDKLWGYSVGKPTFFVKLNKVYGFKAETYNSVSELPPNAPFELTTTVEKYKGGDRIWLTCMMSEGPSIELSFFPGPYYDTDELVGVSRVVAVQMSEVPENVDIIITCTVWAKNIEVDLMTQGVGNAKFKVKMNVKKIDITPGDRKGKPLEYKALTQNPDKDEDKDIDLDQLNLDQDDLDMPHTPDLEPDYDDDQIKTFSSDISTELPDKLK